MADVVAPATPAAGQSIGPTPPKHVAPASAKRAHVGDLGELGRMDIGGSDAGGDASDAGDSPEVLSQDPTGEEQQAAPEDGQDDQGAEPDPEADPEVEPEPDPAAEPLFGMAPNELIAALRNGQLPEEMAAAIYRELEVNGQRVRVDLPELERGYMRRADHTRRLQEMAKERQQAQNVLQAEAQRALQWKDPATLRDGIERMGLFDTFFAAAQGLAREVAAYNAMTPEQQDAFNRQQKIDRDRRELEARQQQLAEREQAIQLQQLERAHLQRLQELVPQAFSRYQIHSSKLSAKVFDDHLQAIVNNTRDFRELTPEIVDEAARATVETLQDLQRYGAPVAQPQAAGNGNGRRPAAPPRPGQSPQLSSTPLPAGPPANGARRVSVQKRASVADMAKLLR